MDYVEAVYGAKVAEAYREHLGEMARRYESRGWSTIGIDNDAERRNFCENYVAAHASRRTPLLLETLLPDVMPASFRGY